MASRAHTDAAPARRSFQVRSRRIATISWRVIKETVASGFGYRVTGLAAEAAFFAVLSLPPLIFALAGAVGYVAQRIDARTLDEFREQVIRLASRALTNDTVTKVIAPTLDEVLSGGRFSVISIGFVIALWSGSRALNVFVDTITIMYGMGGRRSFVKTRALSFVLYVIFLVIGVILLPLVLAGPAFVDAILPARLAIAGAFYWPVVLLGSLCFLATLYHVSVPVRTRWRAELPGAGVTLIIWIGGSALLRLVLDASTGTTSIYGPLAAPIALLLWLYVISIAVLIGAALNAALDRVWPRLSGLHPTDPAKDTQQEPRSQRARADTLSRRPSSHSVDARLDK